MKPFVILAFFTLICLAASVTADRKKTLEALIKGLKMFINLLPQFLTILIAVSLILFFTPNDVLIKWFGKESGLGGMTLSALIGSISLIPGFIAFPLGNILIKNGVSYSVVGIFITTLMMVGIVTLPVEKKYSGLKVAVARNALSFIGAVIIGISIGLLWSIT